MSKMWYLLKVQLLGIFGINKILNGQERKKKEVVRMGLLFAFVFIIFVGMSIAYNYGLLFNLVNWQLESLYLPLVMSITSFILLFTTLYKVNGILFGFKDYDMIMALPVKTSQIVASRIILLYCMNFLFLCIVMVPAGIVYSLMIPTTIIFWIKYVITLFFVPLMPLIIGAVVGSIITGIASRFKRTSLISTLLSIGAISLLIVCISMGAQMAENMVVNVERIGQLIEKFLNRIYPLALLYGQGVCENNLLPLIVFIGISLLSFILFVTFLGMKFKAIHTRLTTTKISKDYKLGELKGATPLIALCKKELRRYFSSSTYVMNTGIGSILLLLAAGSLCFTDVKQIESVLQIPGLDRYLSQFSPLVVAGFMVLTCTTAPSISLEGKNLWILKSIPLDTRTIFLSKLMVQLVVTVPAIIISGFIMIITLQATLIQSILMFVLPLIYTVFIGIVGLIANLKYPKLEWNNEVEVIKQGLATFIAMVVGMVTLIIQIGLMLVLPVISNEIKMLVVTVVMGIITLLAYYYMNTKGVEVFKHLK